MKITSTNDYGNAFSSFAVTADPDATYDVADLITGDFSTSYTSAGVDAAFTVSKTFSSAFPCEYVALAGHTFGTTGGTLTVTVNGVLKDTVVFAAGSNNSVIVSHFESASCTSIVLAFTKTAATDRVTISYIAAGELLALGSQNSEPGGYMRPWMTDSVNARSVINSAAAPVAHIRETVTQKMTLSIANVANSITDSQNWLDFIGRVYSSGDFFIKERDGSVLADDPKSSYLCFDATVAAKSHADTRKLDDIQIKFSALTGH